MKTQFEDNSINDERYHASDASAAIQKDEVPHVSDGGDVQERRWTQISKVSLAGMFGFIVLWVVVIAAVTFYVTVIQPLSPAVATYGAR